MNKKLIQNQRTAMPVAIMAIAVLLFSVLGCKNITNLLGSSKTDELAKKIVGKWEHYDEKRNKTEMEFKSNNSLESFLNGNKTGTGSYRVIDETTVEVKEAETTVNMKVVITDDSMITSAMKVNRTWKKIN